MHPIMVARSSDRGMHGEEVENPQYFEELISAIGAEATHFPERLRCCGGSLIMTSRAPALEMVRILLQSAEKNGADVIATACPTVPGQSGMLPECSE